MCFAQNIKQTKIPKIFKHTYYDSVTQASYAFFDITKPPTDAKILQYGYQNHIFLSEKNTLQNEIK